MAVRHSVFIVGNAGTGKSAIWKTLNRTYHNQKLKPHYNDLNPKGKIFVRCLLNKHNDNGFHNGLGVTNDELFGIINQTTREWKDGLFSVIMRDQVNIRSSGPKWIVLDGKYKMNKSCAPAQVTSNGTDKMRRQKEMTPGEMRC